MEHTTPAAPNGQRQLLFKIGFILFLILFLMIPTIWIQDLINERSMLQQQVGAEVASSWGNEQTIQGPVLCIPYVEKSVVDGKSYESDHLRFVSPEEVNLQSDAVSEVRTKGIFNTVVFTTQNTIKGSFNLETLPKSSDIVYKWSDAALITGITDPAAITDKIITKWSNQEYKTMPGVKHSGFCTSGFHSPVVLQNDQNSYTFEQSFSARGTTGLRFLPSGKMTDIDLRSNWSSPSFIGRLLPQSRAITAEGFTAHWDANEYNRSFPDHWKDAEYKNQGGNNFGVNFVQTADHYQKNMRSAKYAILVISLSFLVFFFYEMLLKFRIHPIQYMMVGMSLVIFYALLLSLTEHIGFNQAYWISAAAVIALIAVYAFAIIKKAKLIVLLTGLFTMLYAYIFILLQLEDYALLAGTIGLFLILASVMIMSRKVDWYRMSA